MTSTGKTLRAAGISFILAGSLAASADAATPPPPPNVGLPTVTVPSTTGTASAPRIQTTSVRTALSAGGRVLTATIGIADGTGATVTASSIRCGATLAGTRLPVGTHSAAAGQATCSFRLPPGAAGKLVSGTITAAAGGASVSRLFTLRVNG